MSALALVISGAVLIPLVIGVITGAIMHPQGPWKETLNVAAVGAAIVVGLLLVVIVTAMVTHPAECTRAGCQDTDTQLRSRLSSLHPRSCRYTRSCYWVPRSAGCSDVASRVFPVTVKVRMPEGVSTSPARRSATMPKGGRSRGPRLADRAHGEPLSAHARRLRGCSRWPHRGQRRFPTTTLCRSAWSRRTAARSPPEPHRREARYRASETGSASIRTTRFGLCLAGGIF